MIAVKREFDLLKGVDNVLKVSGAGIKKASIEKGPRKIFVNLELEKKRINHFTKDRVFKLISGIEARKLIHVVNLPNYVLPVSYNLPTKGIVINLSPFGVDDVLSTKPGPQNLYALLVYGITFSEIVSKKMKVSDRYVAVMADYLTSLLIRFFGKQYGLLGSFSGKITTLKFLTNCYIYGSFFGVTGVTAYRKSAAASALNFKEIENKLKRYDFTTINDYILSLSELAVLPNINRHIFAGKFLQQLGINFLPALEDLGRFIAVITTSDIRGSNIVPTWISKYNERAYNSILEISRTIFKRK